jgi:predicted lipoprotein with Yx(FWY)xxD motif
MRSFVLAGPARLILTAFAALVLAGAGVALPAAMSASAASAHPVASAHPAAAGATAGKSATVVKEATRGHFGKILVTVHGRALYYLPSGSCTGSCLSIWPRLAMPKGKTKPKGASCLGTASFGKHMLQVTYHKHRLYTFVDDSGTSVTGNGVNGFKVAKVVKCK